MPEYLAPGVYVEEISVGPKPIEGVSTSTAAFLGIAEKGPLNEPTLITNPGDFTRTFGGYIKGSYLAYAVDGFFRNGGKRCYVVRVASASASAAYADFAARDGSPLLRVSASSPGVWGRDIQVDVQESSLGNTLLYQSSLAEPATATDNFFKPKSTKGLNAGDQVKLSDGTNETAPLTVLSIDKTDGRVLLDATLGADFPTQTSRAMIVLKADTAGTSYTLTVLSTTGFAAGSLVAFREAGQDTVYAQLATVKPSEKRVGWTGEFKAEDGTAASNDQVQGANLVDVKRVALEFAVAGVSVTGDEVAKANLSPATGADVARIRVGDTLTFGTGKTAEPVTVTQLDATKIYLSPALKNTYPPTAPVSALTAPQAALFSMTFDAANPVPTTDELETGVEGFAVNDTLVFQGGAGGDQALDVVGTVGDTKVKLSGTPANDHTGVVARLKDQATGVVVDNAGGFQANDLALVTNGGTTAALSLAKVQGNRLVFADEPTWSGDVTSAAFLAQQWRATRLNTLEFRIHAKYEKDQTVVEETFDGLSLDPDSKRYVAKEEVINGSSALIAVQDQRPAPVSAPTGYSQMPQPTAAPQPLDQGGDDGLTGLTANDYIGTTTASGDRTGIVALEAVDEVNMLCIPDVMMSFGGGNGALSEEDVELIQLAMTEHCGNLKDRFAILDPIKGRTVQEVQTWRNDNLDSKYAALYYPWIKVQDPIRAENGSTRLVPPSGHVAGVYARSDIERGVHKAPANEVVRGVVELERAITTGEQGALNPDGINCIRAFPGRGIRVWGARTVSSDPEWKYVNVRRLFLYVGESIEEGTQWVVFEPNAEPLWQRVIRTISQFLTQVWRDGALMGTTAEEAFFVKCDRTTMTNADIENGRLICLIGIAPVKPAEFVIFRIHQWPGGSEITE
jgi:phage tail sheath protein FI